LCIADAIKEASMTAHRFATAALSAAALVCGTLGIAQARAADPVKLTGCLIKGDGDDGYLLINPPREPVSGVPQPETASPGAVGTTGVVANIFYWLDKDDDLEPHIGHRVEVEGDLKGNLRDGEIKIDRKEQWTEIEIESAGRDMKARVPNSSVLPGPNSDRKIDVLVRRVDLKKVRMIDATCR
jgi:hypothetical protein